MQTLWQALAELSVPREQDEREVRGVRLTLSDETALDVFRAYEIEGKVTAWRVRGFVKPGGEERVAVVLGTKDDRAMVQWGPGTPRGWCRWPSTRGRSGRWRIYRTRWRRRFDG